MRIPKHKKAESIATRAPSATTGPRRLSPCGQSCSSAQLASFPNWVMFRILIHPRCSPPHWINFGKSINLAILGLLVSKIRASPPGQTVRLKTQVKSSVSLQGGSGTLADARLSPGVLRRPSTRNPGTHCLQGSHQCVFQCPARRIPWHWVFPAVVKICEARWLFWPFLGDTQAPAGH